MTKPDKTLTLVDFREKRQNIHSTQCQAVMSSMKVKQDRGWEGAWKGEGRPRKAAGTAAAGAAGR